MAGVEVVAWVGAITGVGSLVVHGVRLKYDLGAEKREVQKGLRGDLREVLEGVAAEVDKAKTALRFAYLLSEDYPHTKMGWKKLNELAERLTDPSKDEVRVVALRVHAIQTDYDAAVHEQKDKDGHLSTSPRATASRSELKDAIAENIGDVEKMIKMLNKRDRGGI